MLRDPSAKELATLAPFGKDLVALARNPLFQRLAEALRRPPPTLTPEEAARAEAFTAQLERMSSTVLTSTPGRPLFARRATAHERCSGSCRAAGRER